MITITKRGKCDQVIKWKCKTVMLSGCGGAVGKGILKQLSKQLGASQVVACDLNAEKSDKLPPCVYEQLDVRDKERYEEIVIKHKVDQIIHLAAIVTGVGEKNPKLAYDVNVTGSKNALDVAMYQGCGLFIPSSIVCFGGDQFQKDNTPVDSVLQPETMHGVSKVFVETMGAYYRKKYGTDFRCLRYPAIVSSERINRTAGFLVDIFYEVHQKRHYTCYLEPDTCIPAVYIDDCVDATLRLIQADRTKLTRCVYNLGGVSMTPRQMISEVKKIVPFDFTVSYEIDPFRQATADSWPNSLDDNQSKKDWMEDMEQEMWWTDDWQSVTEEEEFVRKIYDNIEDKYLK